MQTGMVFDGLVIAVIALAAGVGAWKGFTRLAAAIVAPVLGFAAGWPLSAEFVEVHRWLAFGLLYLLVTLLVFVFAALARKRLERAKLEGWDRHLGLILGAAQGCVLAVALTLLALSVSGDLRPTVASSRTGGLMVQAIQEVRPLLSQGAADFLGPWFDLLQRRNA